MPNEFPSEPNRLTGCWRKSSACSETECVEARIMNSTVQVRNSREPQGPILVFTFEEWQAFLEGVARDEFALCLVDE
jgi:hypothetical protein